jgi:hypothetical protein
MAILTTAQSTKLQALADYLQGNHDLPIPAEVVDQLAIIFGNTSGFPCSCGVRGVDIRTAFRDEPIRTFIRLLIALNSDATGGTLAATPTGALAP